MTEQINGYMYLDINPEPWAVGPLALGRRGGKMYPRMERNASVHAFKEAVKEAVEGQVNKLPPGKYELEFFFWRRLDSYEGETGRKINAHVADATNMQKALEDALQGYVFDNDRDVSRITSEIVEQGPNVVPGIGIFARTYQSRQLPYQLALDRDHALAESIRSAISDNIWRGPQ